MKLKSLPLLTMLSFALCFSNVSMAKSVDVKIKYSVDELFTLIKNEGYSVEKRSEQRLLIKVNGVRYALYLLDDGDLQMGYGVSGQKISLEKINEWNRTKRLSRAYRDNDGDPMLESDLDISAGVSEEVVVRFIKLFINQSADTFRSYISD